ncbi:MAG: hypothetical protein ABIJ57_07235 [Pseudomonadota bacterium]
MEVLKREELWRYMLAHEPTRKQQKRRYLWEGFIYYLATCRHYPLRALAEIGGLLFIFATGYLLYRLDDVVRWLEEVTK